METKIIKLNNGDELVATISSTDGEFIKVENPLKIITSKKLIFYFIV